MGRAFLVELLVTFLLVLVVIAVATDDRAESGIAPIAVGLALAGELGPLRIYLVAPTLGGVLAAVLYARVFARTEPPE